MERIRRSGRPGTLSPYLKWVAMTPLVFLLAYGIVAVTLGSPRPLRQAAQTPPPIRREPVMAPRALSKQDVQTLLAGKNFLNLEDSRIEVLQGSSCFRVQTTLDPLLQQALIPRLDLKNSRYSGIVAMDPADGRILAMAGYDKSNPSGNPCLDSRFPAASVFKIITAAAAVETCDLEPESILKYEGGQHTLYKSQIASRTSKHATSITLKDSFAKSVNPVFGRLGAHALGKDVIEQYAEAFGFNREINFELPFRPSRIEFSEKAYGLAEVASGFNRTTRITPLHGAMLAAAIVNQGLLIEPTVVDWILNDAGRAVYQSRAEICTPAIDRQTAGVIRELMRATVQSGTARKEFQKHSDDKLFSRLEIGGKTGSMGDGTPNMLYDWFVGYARERQGSGCLVFSVVVAHENYIGTRAAAYATMVIKEYFRSPVAGLDRRLPAAPAS
jgi:penicillin-binding protein A